MPVAWPVPCRPGQPRKGRGIMHSRHDFYAHIWYAGQDSSLHGGPMGVVVAFSGPIGAGKSTISQKVADTLHWPRVSFGDYIKKIAQENGEDPENRAVLQRLGQALVLADVDDLVNQVLNQREWRNAKGE